MSPIASTRARARQALRQDASALRLVVDEPWHADEHGEAEAQGSGPRILIVARGADERMLVRKEMSGALASDTAFAEAGNVWEVLRQAPHCGVVMLAGALPDVSTRTLTELLGRRHPWLPIVVLDPPQGEALTASLPV
jgi:hypothetical protein